MSHTVTLDVRDDIRRGLEPFARIMTAVDALGEGEALVLRAPFEPVPLYRVLGRRGFAHVTERRAADDWTVSFYRAALAGPAEPAEAPRANVVLSEGASPGSAEPAASVLDVRGLEPPEPMIRVLERLDTLGPGEELVVVHDRRPMFLYPQIEDRGFAHETTEVAPGEVRIRVRRATP